MVRTWIVLVFVVVHQLDDLDIHRITFRRPSAIVGFHHLDITGSVPGRGVNSTYHLVVLVLVIFFDHFESPSSLLFGETPVGGLDSQRSLTARSCETSRTLKRVAIRV
jgi:hypothetical protein